MQALFSPQEGSALPLVHPYLLQEATVSRRHLFLAAATVPYHGLSIKIKGKERSAVESLVKDGIKVWALRTCMGIFEEIRHRDHQPADSALSFGISSSAAPMLCLSRG